MLAIPPFLFQLVSNWCQTIKKRALPLLGNIFVRTYFSVIIQKYARTSYRHSLYHLSYTFLVWGNDEENVYKHAAVAACDSRVLRDYSTVYGINAIFLALLIAVVRAL